MNADRAVKIILKPHSTERTFALLQNERKICFIVDRAASKKEIAEAVKVLYNQDVVGVNTARTTSGKKAFVQFRNAEKANDLATDIGML